MIEVAQVAENEKQFFSVELDTTSLEEKQSWNQVLVRGHYSHPKGNWDFTGPTLEGFYRNFKDGVVEHQLAINYNHERGKAAGWVTDLAVKDDGLYALIEWTKSGRESLENKEYKYFSSEIARFWRHHKN